MSLWGRGGIGRHDGLKIRCLVIVREGSSPSVPIYINKLVIINTIKYFIISISFQFFIKKKLNKCKIIAFI